jgi:serine/threonine-protein kinase RsbT
MSPPADGAWIAIGDPLDVVLARRQVRELARLLRMPPPVAEALVTATSEIAHNIVVHAGGGEIHVSPAIEEGRRGLVVVARDHGPGIADPALAMRDGYSTAGSLGLGLASAQRLVDEFDLAPASGGGTVVTLKKWVP